MKKFTLLLILTLVITLSYSQDTRYSRVKIYTGREGISQMMTEGMAFDGATISKEGYVTVELSREELDQVTRDGFRFDILIDDMGKYYSNRSKPYMDRLPELKNMRYDLNDEWPVPQHFQLGPVGGFLTIDQCLAELDSMYALFPDHITPKYAFDSITVNGQSIYWVKISDNPTQNEDEPEILFTGMHHAREPIGMQSLVYFMYYLLENYDTDPEVQYIVDNFQLYFIPIVNMDGYAYNIQTNPNGSGMWRKNRRNNGDGTYGVDVNRNYGYEWGHDNGGSSPDPGDETYRGPYAFSEPSIQDVRDFCNAHEFAAALNYHSYGGLLLYPWGWSPVPCDDDAVFHEHSVLLAKENAFTYGPGYVTIYNTNGGSDDWMYGEQESKPKILSYTPEVGTDNDGFWPVPSRIIPQCQSTMWQNFKVIELAGAYATAAFTGPAIVGEITDTAKFEIKRLGLKDGATYTVSILPLNDAIQSYGDPVEYSDLSLLETQSGGIEYTLRNDMQAGEEILYLLSVDNGALITSDTIRQIFGSPVIVLSDDASTMEKWSSSAWNTTGSSYHSPAFSITDSPSGNYSNNTNTRITLNDPVDLRNTAYAVLEFWAKWDIEAGYDYVQILASDDNGSSWTALNGNYTKPGTQYQAPGQPVYDGVQSDWVKEKCPLDDFLGKEILLRFVLISDQYTVGDGFYWDDLSVTIVDQTTSVPTVDAAKGFAISGPLPNPARDFARFEYSTPINSGDLNLSIYNGNGKLMTSQNLRVQQGSVNVPVSNWGSGIYFFRFRSNGMLVRSGKFIVN